MRRIAYTWNDVPPKRANGVNRQHRRLDRSLPHISEPASSVSGRSNQAACRNSVIESNGLQETKKVNEFAVGRAQVYRHISVCAPHPPRGVLSEWFLRYSLRHKGVTPMGAFGMTIVEGADVGPVRGIRAVHPSRDAPLLPRRLHPGALPGQRRHPVVRGGDVRSEESLEEPARRPGRAVGAEEGPLRPRRAVGRELLRRAGGFPSHDADRLDAAQRDAHGRSGLRRWQTKARRPEDGPGRQEPCRSSAAWRRRTSVRRKKRN
jgi:hypothetical protein